MEPPPPSQASVVRFLSERGGRAPNAELLDHFRASLNSPEARQRFKEAVNAVATVVVLKQEPGGGGGGGSSKYVQLRKKYRNNNNDVAINGPLPSEPEEPSSPPPPPLREIIIKEGEGMVMRESGREEEDGGEREGTVGAEAEVKGREKKKREVEALEEQEHGALTAAALTTTATPPRCGRKALRERRVVGSSPQATKRGGGTATSRDSDSASLASSSAGAAEEEGGGSVALDPLEHAWMLSASEGRWEPLEALLGCEPSLLGKRDFVTGFSCLHWAAKLGRAELVALLVSFGRRRGLPVDVNARTAAGGYTALHLAALHGHLEVVKLLVGAYDADVELRDYSGRKAAHYLGREEEKGLRGLVGGEEEEEAGPEEAPSGRWRLSRVLAHLHLQGDEAEEAAKGRGGGGGGELSRKGSSGGGRSSKPRLNKVRFRTQIIHNTPSFRGEAQDGEEQEEGENNERPVLKGAFKLRPKSNVFG